MPKRPLDTEMIMNNAIAVHKLAMDLRATRPELAADENALCRHVFDTFSDFAEKHALLFKMACTSTEFDSNHLRFMLAQLDNVRDGSCDPKNATRNVMQRMTQTYVEPIVGPTPIPENF